MDWQFNPFAFVLFASAFIAGLLCLKAWKRLGQAPAVFPFMLMMAFVSLWSLGYAVELSGAGYGITFLGVKIAYLGIVSVPVLFFLFAVQYGGLEKYLTKFTISMLFVIPAITLVLNWTSPYHRFFYESYSLDFSGPYVILKIVPGPWYWVHVIYSYAGMFAATLLLARKLKESHRLYREQLVLILSGVILPWAGNVLDTFARPFQYVNIGPLSFVIMGMLFSYALFKKRFLDIIPVARNRILEFMTDGMLVLDAEGRILDINMMMLEMAGIGESKIIGMPASLAFGSVPVLPRAFTEEADGGVDVTITRDKESRHYRVRRTGLFCRQNNRIGTLIIMSDMTELYSAMKELQSTHARLEEKTHLIVSMNRDLEKKVRETVDVLREKEELLTLQGRYATMGEMIDFTAHQWKQNLYAANLGIEAMKNIIHRGEAVEIENINSMEAALKNMTDTLREFRNFVAPADDGAQSFFIRESIDSALSLIRDMLMVDGISVKKDYHESPRVCGYRNELSQVVMNIINNARAISRLRNIENPEINISLFRDKDDAVLSITDNGGGIDKKAIPMLFNKFYSTTESSGLGLYISRMIIEQHFNGTISAASEGRYAVFTMRFPRAEFGADSSSEDI